METKYLERAIASFSLDAFAEKVGGRKESRSAHSSEWLFNCPFCHSSRLRFNTKKRIGICFGCRKGFDAFKLVRDLMALDDDDAISYFLSRYVGGDSTAARLESSLRAYEAPKPVIRKLPAMPWPEGVEYLTTPNAPHYKAWAYLYKRGIDVHMVQEFGLGYGRTGRLRERIVFPCRMDGALVYWQARAIWDPPPELSGEALREWREKTGYIKSLNPPIPERAEAVAHAHEILFNYERARVAPHVVIVEGPVDAIKVGLHSVALLGKTAGPAKLARLKEMRASRFTIYLDYGKEELASAMQLAKELSAFAEVFWCSPPEGYDAGALDRASNSSIVERAVRWVPTL